MNQTAVWLIVAVTIFGIVAAHLTGWATARGRVRHHHAAFLLAIIAVLGIYGVYKTYIHFPTVLQEPEGDPNQADNATKQELAVVPVEGAMPPSADRQSSELYRMKKRAHEIAASDKASLNNRSYARLIEQRTDRQLELRAKLPKPGLRIVNGRPAKIGQFPYQVALVWTGYKEATDGFFCGGSLIDREWVLTAAHCLNDDTDPSDFQVYIGSVSLAGGGHFMSVAKGGIFRYKFDPATEENDVAVLHLDHAVQEQWVDLADDSMETQMLKYSRNGTVSGWGVTKEGGDISDSLLWANVPIVDRTTCGTSYKSLKDSPMNITDQMLCAGNGKADACQGDSGGPFVLHTPDNKIHQLGIVGWGEGCANKKFPGVYTRIPAYVKWIRQCMDGGKCPHDTPAAPNVATANAKPQP